METTTKKQMTMKELFEMSDALAKVGLTRIEQQIRFIVRVNASVVPCPSCNGQINAFIAGGVDFNSVYTDKAFPKDVGGYKCPLCDVRLTYCVPMMVGGGANYFFTVAKSAEPLIPFELVDPNAGGAVYDLEHLTEKEAIDRNRIRRANGSDYRWIKAKQ
jgi:hypothetical protein